MAHMEGTGDSPQSRDGRLLKRAVELYAQRRVRDRTFESQPDLFGEPGWDLMLDLYVACKIGKDVSTTSACIAASTPTTTALRWIGTLEARGLVLRRPDPSDRRRQLICITNKGILLMEQYLSQC